MLVANDSRCAICNTSRNLAGPPYRAPQDGWLIGVPRSRLLRTRLSSAAHAHTQITERTLCVLSAQTRNS